MESKRGSSSHDSLFRNTSRVDAGWRLVEQTPEQWQVAKIIHQFKAVGTVFFKKNPCRSSGGGDGVSRFARVESPEDVVLNLYGLHAAKEYRCVKVVRTDHDLAHFGQTRFKIAIHGINETNVLEFGHFGT
jgi:hypothetical protein